MKKVITISLMLLVCLFILGQGTVHASSIAHADATIRFLIGDVASEGNVVWKDTLTRAWVEGENSLGEQYYDYIESDSAEAFVNGAIQFQESSGYGVLAFGEVFGQADSIMEGIDGGWCWGRGGGYAFEEFEVLAPTVFGYDAHADLYGSGDPLGTFLAGYNMSLKLYTSLDGVTWSPLEPYEWEDSVSGIGIVEDPPPFVVDYFIPIPLDAGLYRVELHAEAYTEISYEQQATATIDFDPDTLNLTSGGKWGTCYIELPEDYNVEEIAPETVRLWIGSNSILAEDKPFTVGDYDVDGIPDLMVKFSREAIIGFLQDAGITTGDVTLTINGQVGSSMFEGTDTIRIVGATDGTIDEGRAPNRPTEFALYGYQAELCNFAR